METPINPSTNTGGKSKKEIFVIAALVVLILFLTAFLTYFITSAVVQKKSLTEFNSQDLYSKTGEKTVASISNNLPTADETVNMASDVIKKGYIQWQDPVDAGDLGLTNKKIYNGCNFDECDVAGVGSSGVKYWKVGTVAKGAYAGAELLVISSEIYEGPSARNIFRIFKKDGNITFLSNVKYGFDDYMKTFVQSYFFNGSEKKSFNDKISIEELNFPDKLQGENERQQFVRDGYAEAFFTSAKLKVAFAHPQFGQVWMTDEVKALNENPTPFEPNGYVNNEGKKNYYDIFGRQGFYIKAPDGMAVSYKLVVDIFTEKEDNRYAVISATWNDGKKNDKEFEKNPSGCGSGNYVYDETLQINPSSDLVIVGKTDKGDNLYGYRDTSLVGFLKLYNETYWVSEGKEKASPEEFLKKYPKVFWIDPFGRVLAFYNSEFISPAECGKPVIYLYPEKPMDVSVKVEPGNGLSFTDPVYENGWRVRADENGQLTNSADGKIYPYLFWEGAGDVYYERPKQGFVAANENLEAFFDEKLAKLGLIQKEINDFKEFWIPQMRKTNQPYYFITFLSARFIDQLAPLRVDPKPDTVIRILMDWEGLNAYQRANEFPIRTPERKGFTVVEWGGMLK